MLRKCSRYCRRGPRGWTGRFRGGGWSLDLDVLELCVVREGGGQEDERERKRGKVSPARKVRPEQKSLEQNGRTRRSTGVERVSEGGRSEGELGCETRGLVKGEAERGQLYALGAEED
jgi:hypothetical protein